MIRTIIATALALSCLTSAAAADTLIKCGESKGYSYSLEGGTVAAKDAGWTEDQISRGQITFSMKEGNPQLLISDTAGTRNIANTGAKVIVTQSNVDTLVVLVLYPSAIETYVFRVRTDGQGEVVWSSAKATGAISKGTLMRASCKVTS